MRVHWQPWNRITRSGCRHPGRFRSLLIWLQLLGMRTIWHLRCKWLWRAFWCSETAARKGWRRYRTFGAIKKVSPWAFWRLKRTQPALFFHYLTLSLGLNNHHWTLTYSARINKDGLFPDSTTESTSSNLSTTLVAEIHQFEMKKFLRDHRTPSTVLWTYFGSQFVSTLKVIELTIVNWFQFAGSKGVLWWNLYY